MTSSMTSLDGGAGRLRSAASHLLAAANVAATTAGVMATPITGRWDRFAQLLKVAMPKGLYARALLIIIVPMVVVQSVVAFMFVERQWNLVNYYLSSAVTREIATLIDVYKSYPQGADRAELRRIAQERLGTRRRFPPRDAIAAAGAEAVLLAARCRAVRRNPQARAAVLDRHGRAVFDR